MNEVDGTALDLYPDEDYIARILHDAEGEERYLQDVLADVNPLDYWHPQVVESSLKYNGIIAAKEVPLSNIRRHRIVKRDGVALLDVGADAVPSPDNYQILGEFYKRCIAALFEGGEDAMCAVAAERHARFGEAFKD